MTKLGSGMYCIVVVALVLAGMLTLARNLYKSHFQKEEPVSFQEAVESYGDKVGYPAGDDIPVAKSIEDIMNYEYCTIEVSQENLEALRYFKIKDISESGNKSSKVGRSYYSSNVYEMYSTPFTFLGNLRYATRQLSWNINNVSYGEWCIVTLESGERLLVLADLKLLDIPKTTTVKLPIGQLIENYYVEDILNEHESYHLEKENAIWYVDMVGDWEEKEVGDINVMWRFILVSLITFVVMVAGAYHYAKKNKLI